MLDAGCWLLAAEQTLVPPKQHTNGSWGRMLSGWPGRARLLWSLWRTVVGHDLRETEPSHTSMTATAERRRRANNCPPAQQPRCPSWASPAEYSIRDALRPRCPPRRGLISLHLALVPGIESCRLRLLDLHQKPLSPWSPQPGLVRMGLQVPFV